MEENPEDEFNNGENGNSDNPLNKLGPTVPPVNIDEDGVLISFKTTISGGIIKLKGDVDSETEDKDIGTAPNDIFYTLKQLLTPRVFTVVKEGTISNDVYRVTAIEKLNEKKTDTDLIFTYYDISVEKQQEDGTFVQDQYITPVQDGILDRDKNNFCRLDFLLEEIPPEKTIDSGFIFEANYPEGYPLFYQIGDGEVISIPSGQQLKVDYDISSIEEDFEPGDPNGTTTPPPTNQLEELRVFTTDKSNEFEIKTFKLISQDGEQSATNGSIVVPLIEELIGSILTFQVDVVKKAPLPPTKRKVIISGDVVDELVGFKLSNGKEGLVGLEQQTFEIEISETQGNYIQFYNPFNISYSEYDLNITINNGNKKRESNVFETQEEIGENDLNILVVLTKAAKTPPPNQPVIQLRETNIEYNLTQGRDLRIDFSTKNTDEIEYSIGNIVRTIPTKSPLLLKKEDFQNGFGQYIVRFRPYSRAAGSGEVVSLNINVVENRFIPGPDIQRIDYPANIQGEDFAGLNIPFDIVLQSINTNYVEIYSQKITSRNLLVPKASPNGKIPLNIKDVLSVGKVIVEDIQDKIELKLFLVPYNTEADDIADGRVEEISIIFDRGLRIKREDVVKDLREAFQREFDTSVIELESQKFLTHQLHLGDGKNRIISTWATDNLTFDDDSLVLKLYEPLPPEIQTEKQVWISKLQSIPVIDEVEIVDEVVKVCTPLQPNFNIDVVDPIGYEMIDTLIASGSSTSNQLISTYLSSSEFTTDELGIHYVTGSGSTEDYNWNDFVKYSSAEERVNNFWYKLRLLESYESDLSNLQTGTEWTGSVDVVNEANRVQGKINTLKGGFDSFEKYLYDTTGSLAYPKTGLTPVASSTSAGQDWYYVTASVSAREYDRNNFDSLVNNIPLHVKNNQNGQEFVLFFSMIGQHFDILWQYTNSVYNMKNLEHKKDIGIANELVYHMLESFGWEANSSVTSAMLWDYAFGKDKDGNSTATMTGEQRQQEIWRRILNNLPYLLKHKGTKRALHAAMSCYGIPTSLLSIVEFGGPNEPTRSTTTKTTFDDRTAALNFDTNAEIIVPWKEYIDTFSIIDPADYRFTSQDYFSYTERAVASNNDYIAVGAYRADIGGVIDRGAVYVYDVNDLSKEPTILSASFDTRYFGESLSIHSNTLIVGAPSADPTLTSYRNGSIHIYDLTDLSQEPIIKTFTPGFDFIIWNYGKSIDVSSNYLVVGAVGTSSTRIGATFVYDINNIDTSPIILRPITPKGSRSSVAISDNHIVVGYPYDDDGGNEAGSIYVYDVNNLSDNPLQLIPSEINDGDRFGWEVECSNTHIVVRSQRDNGSFDGAVYVYDTTDLSQEPIKLTPPDFGGSVNFGRSLLIKDDYLYISAPFDDEINTNSGAIYIYTLSDLSQSPVKISNENGFSRNEYFGTSLSINDNQLVIGAGGFFGLKGRVYVYDLDYLLSPQNPYPNSIEARLQTNIKEDQTIFESEGNWSVDIIKTTGSLAYLQMSISSSSDLEVVSSSTFPFFNEEYTQVVINRDFSGSNEVIELYAKEGFQGRIRNEASASITLTTSNWESGSELKVGGGLSGSMDEFRLWRVALNEQSIENHTLMPDAIDGNSYTASTEDLLFRLDFEYPRNLSVESSSGIPSGSVLNVSVRNNYGESYATASNFPTEASYPYNYTAYDRTVVANVPSIGITFGQKVRFEEQVKISDLSYKSRSTKKSFDQAPIDSDKLGLFFSPVKEINMDILKSLGNFNIDDYIGNPTDRYEDEYKDLKTLRNYYFDRFNLNLYEYIQLVRYIDKTIFTTLESLVPARAKVSKGLLIEPHFLERSKVKWSKPTGSLNNYESVIDVNEDVIVSSDVNNYDTTIVVDEDITLTSEKTNYDTVLDVDTEINLESSYDTFDTSIDTEELIVLTSDVNNYDTTISTEDNTILSGEITRNSGSDMGGISISVDAKIEGTISSEYESDSQIQAGMGSESPSQIGFGLFAKDGVAIRTRYDKNNNLVQDRVKVFQITEQFTQNIPQNISSTDPSLGTENISVTKTREKVSILPFTGSDGNESPDLTVGGNIVAVTKLDGYFPSHFRYVGDRTTGFQNSFSEGSKQRASTTIDGSSPVESFTTNPNTLRVSDTGRGSGEPILEVD